MIFTPATLIPLGNARSAVRTAPIVWAGSTAKRMRMRKSKNFLIRPGGGRNYKKKSLTNLKLYAIIKAQRGKENPKPIETCGCAPARGQIKGRKRIKPTGLNYKPAD